MEISVITCKTSSTSVVCPPFCKYSAQCTTKGTIAWQRKAKHFWRSAVSFRNTISSGSVQHQLAHTEETPLGLNYASKLIQLCIKRQDNTDYQYDGCVKIMKAFAGPESDDEEPISKKYLSTGIMSLQRMELK